MIVVLLYLTDCCIWVPRGGVVLRTWGRGRYKVVYPSRVLGNERGGLVFLNPLPPFGGSFIVTCTPLSLSRIAMFSYTAACTDPAGRSESSPCFLPFADVRGIWSAGRKVQANGRLLLKTHDETLAASIADQLRRLWLTPESQREAMIANEIAMSLDCAAVQRRVGEFDQEVRSLRRWCFALFVLLIGGVPTLGLVWQLRFIWPWVAGAILFCIGAIVRKTFAAHRQLYSRDATALWQLVAGLLFMPTTAVRACDRLGRRLLLGFHPLAAALVLCGQDEFSQFVRRTLLDLRNPRLPACPGEDSQWSETEAASFRQQFATAAATVLKRAGWSVEQLTAPPCKAEAEALTFCPRCDLQFRLSHGVCSDCGGLLLKPF